MAKSFARHHTCSFHQDGRNSDPQKLQRTVQLGYTPDDAEYKPLRDQISDLRKQIKSQDDPDGLFSTLKAKLATNPIGK